MPNAPQVQASTVDHALLAAGALPAATYFGGEVAELVDRLLQQANWRRYVIEKEAADFVRLAARGPQPHGWSRSISTVDVEVGQ